MCKRIPQKSIIFLTSFLNLGDSCSLEEFICVIFEVNLFHCILIENMLSYLNY